VLLGNDVQPLASREEAALNAHRHGVEGVSGSRAAHAAVALLKAALQVWCGQGPVLLRVLRWLVDKWAQERQALLEATALQAWCGQGCCAA